MRRVVVDDSCGLHPGIDDHRTDKLEASLLECLGNLDRQWGLRSDGTFALNGFSSRQFPDAGREILTGVAHLQKNAGASDRGVDLGARTDDAFIFQQPIDIALRETGNLRRIKLFECRSQRIALLQHDDPGQTRLKSLQHQQFPQRPTVVYWHAPLSVVVLLVKRITFCPGTAPFCAHVARSATTVRDRHTAKISVSTTRLMMPKIRGVR